MEQQRREMVAAVRSGESMRSVARRYKVHWRTVQRYVQRAHGLALDDVNWSDRPHTPRRTTRSSIETEETVLQLRQELKETSDLGEYGARAIHAAMVDGDYSEVPSVRTIGRILERRGVLEKQRRVRRPAPPIGWYLPQGSHSEIDSLDIVEGLVIKDGPEVEVLNCISLHGGLPAAWPGPGVYARTVVYALVEHWRSVGLPTYAQFDNGTQFQGAHHIPDTIGRVIRLCLHLGVIPVFIPPRESGFQAAIESFNGRWQSKVWTRFHHASLDELEARSLAYITASRQRSRVRIDNAPLRRPFPRDWHFDLQAHPTGKMIWLRRTNDDGAITMLGRTFTVDPSWSHRLVRADVDLAAGCISFHALRRRQPHCQPLLKQVPYTLPNRRFRG